MARLALIHWQPAEAGTAPEQRTSACGGPAGLEATLGALPGNVTLVSHARGKADVILLLSRSRLDLKRRWQAARRMMADGGRLWLAWPKKAPGRPASTAPHPQAVRLA